MGIIIDLVIVLFILASVFLGYRKGLISLGIHLCAFIIAIIITFLLYRPIAIVVINSTTIDEKLQETIQTNVKNFMTEDKDSTSTNSLIESAKKGMLPEASRTLAINIIYGITMILLFTIVRICLIFINSIANAIAKLPILKQFNKLGGIIYGLLRGFLIVYVFLMLMNLVIAVSPKSSINQMINDSYIAKTMATYNILNVFFK